MQTPQQRECHQSPSQGSTDVESLPAPSQPYMVQQEESWLQLGLPFRQEQTSCLFAQGPSSNSPL